MADNSKFVIEFKAQMDDLKKAIKEITNFQKKQTQQAKFDKRVADQDYKQKQRNLDKERKEMRRDRKEEQTHALRMAKQMTKGQSASKKERDAKKKERKEEKEHQAALFSGITKASLAAGGIMLAAKAIGMVYNFAVGGAQAGYQKYSQYNQALGRTTGMFATPGAARAGIANAPGARYGFSKIDTAEQVGLMGRSTGVAGPREMQQAMRATGMESGEIAQFFGTLRRGGADFTGGGGEAGAATGQSAGAKQFKDMMAAGVASGIEKARLPEFLAGIQDLTEQAQSMAGDAVDPTNIAKVAAVLGRSGAAGLQGARGAAVMSSINQGMLNPKSEEAAAAIRQAFGFGLPGGNTDYYTAEKRREQGISGKNNLQDVVGYVGKMGGGNKQETALMMRSMFGTSLDINEKLIDAIKKGPTSSKEVEDLLKSSEPLEVQADKAILELPAFLKHRAEIDDKLLGVGERVAPAVEAIEDLETQLLQQIIELLTPILHGITEIADYFTKQKPEDQIRKREAEQIKTLEETKKRSLTGMSGADAFNMFAGMQVSAAGMTKWLHSDQENAQVADAAGYGKAGQEYIKRHGLLGKKSLSDQDDQMLRMIAQGKDAQGNPIMDLGGTVFEDQTKAQRSKQWAAEQAAGNKNAGSAPGPVTGGNNGYQSMVTVPVTVITNEGTRVQVQSSFGTDRAPGDEQTRPQ